MKILKSLIVFLAFTSFAFAQEDAKPKKTETIEITTSAVCGMCKEKIEVTLFGLKGVKYANLDLSTKGVTVKYKPSELSPEQLRTRIAQAGYDADSVAADPQAYEKLNACCKKGGHQ